MEKTIRIGTRSSELALWQANIVAEQLNHLEYKTEIIKIDTLGDEVLHKPIYKLGTIGVFTKTLDTALLNDKIDIAVNSLKDVPTNLPEGIIQAAVLKRGDFNDVLVYKNNDDFFANKTAIIATGSLRRRAQWLYRYPNHKLTDLRGNINTRLQKLKDNDWDGAIFALAGLKRIKLLPKNNLKLDWMIPAPAQGAVMIASLEKNQEVVNICKELNHKETEICTTIERDFLNALDGGCSAPVAALATINGEELKFKFILDRGGKKMMRLEPDIEKDILIFSTKNLSINQTSALKPIIGIDMSDFITIQYNRIKPVIIKNNIKNVVFTSQSAVDSVINSFDRSALDFTHIYCVGRKTKRLIEKNIGKVAHVEDSAEKLANYLVKNINTKEVTFFCGNKRRNELPNILNQNNIKVNEVESYKTDLSPNNIDPKYKGILFFSPSAIESYISQNKSGNAVAFCIGNTTAKEAKKHFKNIVIAKMPTTESILKSVNEQFTQK